MMQRALVQIALAETNQAYDLEVPAELPAAELAQLVVAALGWPEGRYEVLDRASGRALQKSLAEEGLWDGASLAVRRLA